MSVGAGLKSPPFQVNAGSLAPARGDGPFLPYRSVMDLKEQVDGTFSKRVSFRVVFGSHGSGKTWTLSWLWREFERPAGPGGCLVLGVPRFEIRQHPERSLVSSLLRSVATEHPALLQIAAATGAATASEDLRSLRDHFDDFASKQTLLGYGSTRVKATENARAFSLNSSGDLTRLTLSILEAVALAGYPRCLVLVDELEAPFILDPRKDRTIFSEFLRGVYDQLVDPPKKGPHYPRTQFLFAGTLQIFEDFQPGAITRTSDQGSLMHAFIRRTDPPFLLKPPSSDELHKIARRNIELSRDPDSKQKGMLPFDTDAIDEAWTQSGLVLGIFVQYALAMYELAERDPGAKSVTKAHLERALARFTQEAG
jgi:hypothetical protein